MSGRSATVFLTLCLAGCMPAVTRSEPPAPTPAPCHVEARELEVLRAELHEIDADLEKNTPEDLRRATTRMAALLQHPAFFTQEGRPAVQMSADPRAFVDWWNRGGESWARDRLERPATDVMAPPGVRSVIDPDTVPAEILCTSADCDPLASGFIDTVVAWGLKLEAYERRRHFYEESFFGNAHQRQCTSSDAAGWLSCVSAWRSVQPELPLGDYRFPTSGWLFAELGGIMIPECPTYFGFNLETGAWISASDCELRRGQGSVERFREFALLALLSGQVEEVSQWQRIRAPEGLDLSGTCSLDSAPPWQMIRTSAHARLYYWWWRDGKVVARGTRSPTSYEQPASGLAVKLLRVAEYTVVEGEAVLPEHVQAPDDDQPLAELLGTLRE
jgi:hypothetical protein